MDPLYVYSAGIIVSIILLIAGIYLHATTPHKDFHSIMLLFGVILLLFSAVKYFRHDNK